MPSPESPANRTTAPRMTEERLVSEVGRTGLAGFMTMSKLSKVLTPLRGCQIWRPKAASESGGRRGVAAEEVAEAGCRGFDLLLRHGLELVVSATDDLALRLLGSPVGDREQGVGDTRRVLAHERAGRPLLLDGLLIDRVEGVEEIVEQAIDGLLDEAGLHALDDLVGAFDRP